MKNNIKKPRISIIFLIVVILFTLVITACQSASVPDIKEDILRVTVSIPPQAYFVERIGGELVDVNVMVGPGEEAHTYEPLPEQMRDLDNSQVFFSIGIEYENAWIPKFRDINPDLQIVDSSTGIQRVITNVAHTHEDDEEEIGDSHHEEPDPHVWLSPANGKIIAKNIFQALESLSPENSQIFKKNYDVLIADIEALDASITQILSSAAQRTFMVFHPAWGYFASQYNLEQIAVQIGGQDPSPAELADLVKIAQTENIRVIFIQPTFSTASIHALSQEINAEIVSLDPLAEDWLANLEAVASAFAAALE
jgi:zinc transport system substrate-binding protein